MDEQVGEQSVQVTLVADKIIRPKSEVGLDRGQTPWHAWCQKSEHENEKIGHHQDVGVAEALHEPDDDRRQHYDDS